MSVGAGGAAYLIILQNSTLVESPLVGWLAVNSLALLGLVYYAGKLVGRLETVERDNDRMEAAHVKHVDESGKEGRELAALTVQVETLNENYTKLHADVMKYLFNGRGE